MLIHNFKMGSSRFNGRARVLLSKRFLRLLSLQQKSHQKHSGEEYYRFSL